MKDRLKTALRFIRRNRVMTRLLSFILTLVLVFYVIPSTIYVKAQELLETDESDAAVSVDASEGSASSSLSAERVGVLFEDESLREESTKHFHLEDGTYLAAQYNYPVHTLDANGEWQDIDNVLSELGKEFTNNSARIKFAKNINGSSELFTLHDGNAKITMTLIGANKGTSGEVTNNSDAESESKLQKMMNLEKLSSKIIYRDILDGVDLEYIAYSMNVKENIIVKEMKDSYSYSFELKLNGLTPTLTERGDIELRSDDTDELTYVIPAPVVYDSVGEHAPGGISAYTLTHINGKKYMLTVTVESEWMNKEERAFPVTIDPAVFCRGNSILDFSIDSESPNTNDNGEGTSYVSSTKRTYLKLVDGYLPKIPLGSTVVKAEISIITSKTWDNSADVGAYEIISYWDNSLTWNKTVSASPQGTFGKILDYVTISSNSTRSSWDITDVYKKWLSGAANYGIGFRLMDESISQTGASFTTFEYYPGDDDGNFYEPAVIVNYVHMGGLEEYYATSSHSAGIAGSGSVNLASGNLVFSIPTLTTTDGIFGYTPTLYYNSYLANKPYVYGNAKTAYSASYMPYGFKLNMCETIVKENYAISETETGTHYIHADADGTEHPYNPSPISGEENIFYDEDALGKKMTVETNEIEITDDSHIIKRFFKMATVPNTSVISAWYLGEIEDKAGNKLIFVFDSTYRPVSIKLRPNSSSSDILLMRLLYTSDGKLCAIYDHGTQNAVVLKYSSTYNGSVVYSGGKYLEGIEYCYMEYDLGDSMGVQGLDEYASLGDASQPPVVDSSAEYYYNMYGQLLSAEDYNTDHGIEYQWSNKTVIRIREQIGQEVGKSLSFDYLTGATDVYSPGNDGITKTADDIVTRYVFDSFGRAISCYSTSYDREKLYGAVMGEYDTQANSKNSLTEKTVSGSVKQNLLSNGDFRKIIFKATGTLITSWTKSSNVTRNTTVGIGGAHPSSIGFSPTVGFDAYVSQNVSLAVGDYTLTVNYSSTYVYGTRGYAKILDSNGNVLKSKELKLNNGETRKDSETVSFTLTSAMTVTVKIVFTATEAPSSLMSIGVGMVKLEQGDVKTDYTLMQNGGFDNGVLTEWSAGSGATASIYSDEGSLDYSAKVTASGITNNYIKQNVYSAPIDVLNNSAPSVSIQNPVDLFIVSGFAKAENAVASKPLRLRVEITYYLGTGEDDITVNYYYNFNPHCTDWQYVSGTFSLDKYPDGGDLPIYKCVRSVDLYCESFNQIGDYALFDDINITYKGVSDTYKNVYNSDGRIAKSINGYYTEYYEYNDDGNLSRVANSLGELTDYVYTSVSTNASAPKNFVSCVNVKEYYRNTTGSGMTYPYWESDPNEHITVTEKSTVSYQYNAYGKVKSMVTSNASDASLFTKEEYTYNEDLTSKLFGLVLTEQNRQDSKTKYFYENYSGRLLACINVYSGSGYVYTYDEMGRLLRVNPANYTASTDTYTANTSGESVEYTYGDEDRITKISTSTTDYTFSYDDFGNTSRITIGDGTLVTYAYSDYNGKTERITYGNGFYTELQYNEKEQLSEVSYNGTPRYRYEYTDDGQIGKLIDLSLAKYVVYYYDSERRFVGFREYDQLNNELISSKITYNTRSFITDVRYEYQYNLTSGKANDYIHNSYNYHEDGRINTESAYNSHMSFSASYSYDALDRITSVVYNGSENTSNSEFNNTVEYTYRSDAGYGTTGLISEYASTVGYTLTSYTYTYDSNGNITKIAYSDGKEIRYYYDDLGQLIREDNGLLNATFVYSYDRSGNITQKNTYRIVNEGTEPTSPIQSITYSYTDSDWSDLLTSFGGHTIVYDEMGNPTSYYNGYSYSFTWEGRKLASASRGTYSISYTYGENGLRSSKTIGDVTTNYYYDGSLLVKEESPSYTIAYIYDSKGSPSGFMYRAVGYSENVWDTYFFEKNLQGDIVAVYDASGTKLVSYRYNAWGMCVATYHNNGNSTGAVNNPFRYRGYYYDVDLSMYYLQSRFYDPIVGRFISSDDPALVAASPAALTDKNLFAYCDNNPVMRTDESGEFWNYVIGTVVGGIIGGYLGYLTAKETGSDITSAIITGAILGATSGAIVSSGNAKMISGGISGVLSKTTTDVISASYGSAIGTWEDYATAFIFGSISSIVDNGTKTVLDVAVRPAFNQIVKMHTRGKEFDEQKYAYDVVTRGLTSGGTRSVLQATFGGQVIKVDLGKCFFRATLRKVYSYFNGG